MANGDQSVGRRSISSIPIKCGMSSAPPVISNHLPTMSFQYLRAHNTKPDLIEPGSLKTLVGILDSPSSLIISHIVDLPIAPILPKIQPNIPVVQDPTTDIEYHAARLIVIRRRKMRRHKLKKLRKKMKFVWAKRRQRREMKKEKEFQAELMGKIREAEKFDAAAYASAKIDKANEVLIPKLWKGKRLPEFVIKDLLEERSIKQQKYLEKAERRKKMVLNVSEYKVSST